jgi:hypothetical protein
MIMKSDFVVVSNHHRRSLFFEDSMRHLWLDGYRNILVQETGSESWGPYQGPGDTVHLGTRAYDQGMVQLKRTLANRDWKVMLLVDNDCFLSGATEVNRFVAAFLDGNYGFASHHVSADSYKDYYDYSNGPIAHVTDQKFIPADIYPGFCPDPHWENAYTLITRDAWDKLSEDDVSHTRKWFKALHENGEKMGAHKAKYRLIYTHYGDEWFHWGNLMAYYYRLERRQPFSPESKLDMSRLGYFLKQDEYYGPTHPQKVDSYLNELEDKYREQAIEAYTELVKDTCLDRWSIWL